LLGCNGAWCSRRGRESNGGSKLLVGINGWRREAVDDVQGLPKAEILITDEVYGRESRGGGCAFEKTKGESVTGVGNEPFRVLPVLMRKRGK
jgi:hypothetical protein